MTTTETYQQEYDAICSFFKEEWNARAPSIKIFWQNQKADANNQESRVELYVLPASSQPVSIGAPGNNRFRHAGVVLVNLYVESGSGLPEILTLVEYVVEIFRRKQTETVYFLDPSPTPRGNEANWYKYSVSIPFYRDSFA